MTVTEADKINGLYQQLDALMAENAALKAAPPAAIADDLAARLNSIEAKLDRVLDKGNTK